MPLYLHLSFVAMGSLYRKEIAGQRVDQSACNIQCIASTSRMSNFMQKLKGRLTIIRVFSDFGQPALHYYYYCIRIFFSIFKNMSIAGKTHTKHAGSNVQSY